MRSRGDGDMDEWRTEQQIGRDRGRENTGREMRWNGAIGELNREGERREEI